MAPVPGLTRLENTLKTPVALMRHRIMFHEWRIRISSDSAGGTGAGVEPWAAGASLLADEEDSGAEKEEGKTLPGLEI